MLTIFYVYYNRSFPQNLYHWLLEKSEMINLQMLVKKNTFNFLIMHVIHVEINKEVLAFALLTRRRVKTRA